MFQNLAPPNPIGFQPQTAGLARTSALIEPKRQAERTKRSGTKRAHDEKANRHEAKRNQGERSETKRNETRRNEAERSEAMRSEEGPTTTTWCLYWLLLIPDPPTLKREILQPETSENKRLSYEFHTRDFEHLLL